MFNSHSKFASEPNKTLTQKIKMASVEKKIFKCDFFPSTLVSGLGTLRKDNQLYDVVLKVQGRSFSCHKLVLAANSEYFLKIFTADTNERESEEIMMPSEIDAEAIETLLNYFYTGELTLSQGNIESVFRATDYMRLDSLLEICIQYMQETLDPSNCIRHYVMADSIQYSCPGLDSFRKAVFSLIVEEPVEVTGTVAFLSLSVELISKILKSDSEPEKADSRYMLILKWVGHDEENRRAFLYDLLQMLPVDGIGGDFFTSKIGKDELLERDPKTASWLLGNSMQQKLSLVAPQIQTNSLLIADLVDIQKCFLVKLEDPTPLAICDRPASSWFSAVSHKKRIYLLCGNNTEKSYRLNGPQETWAECDLDLKFGRASAGCVVLGDDIFVIGGWDWRSESALNSCMKFNFDSGRKENLPAMSEKRHLPGAAVYANSVYAVCGSGASSSIERFDAREGRWCAAGRYETEFEWCSSAIIGDYLYTCGIGSRQIERFDFRTNRSQEISSFPSSCGWNWISSVENDLFGAFAGQIFKYEAATGKWNNFCSGMNILIPVIVPWI